MKKNFKYAILSAIAFVGAVSFSACQSSDEIIDNPNYNSETNTVKTQFAISIPNAGKTTRMGATDVQASDNFLGIKDFHLLSFLTKASGIGSTGGNSISLPNIGTFTTDLDGSTYAKAQLFADIEIPVNTQSFLLYGEANNAEVTDKFARGSIVTPKPTGTGTLWTSAPDDFQFSLENIYSGGVDSKATAIVTYLKNIAKASGWSNSGDGTKLLQLYNNFTSMHAGSSASIQAAVKDLYHSIFSQTDAVSAAIKAAILDNTYASDANLDGNLVFTEAISGYPANINLPDGAAYIEWNSQTPKEPSVNIGKGNWSTAYTGISLNQFTYPAALYYRTKSDIQTSTSFEKSHYVSSNDWSDILEEYTEGEIVTGNTRSVAIVTPLQYAVGRLDLKVKIESTTLYDRNGEVVTLDGNKLKLTGVVIGGQGVVNHEFMPTGNPNSVIYDKVAANTFVDVNEPASVQNYTLVFETPASGDNQKVSIALEFENTGEAFQGVDGIIPKGTKFYLIAELDPTKAADIKTGTTARSKVFEQDYVTTVELKIGNGIATTGNDEGLGNAYNVIPDLRSKAMELGLSVNLEWTPGMTFDKTI